MASIRERVRKDGSMSWAVLWRDPDLGKQTSATVDTESEASTLKRLLDANGQRFSKVEELLSDPQVSGPRVTTLMYQHIDELTEASSGTLRKYRAYVKNHISERLGHMRVAEVEHHHLVGWIKWMLERDLSPKTIANVHGLISAAFNTAIVRKYRTDNPCAHVKLPSRAHADEVTTYLTRDEYAKLLKCVPDHWKLMVEFMVATGLRFGEVTALRWSEMEMDSAPPRCRVIRAWKEDDTGNFYIGPPKSRRSKRAVSFPKALATKLRKKAGEPDDLVFKSPTGNAIRAWTFHEQCWTPTKAAAKIGKEVRPHDLRHTHATWLIQGGMSLAAVSRRMGHESIAITADLYGHHGPEGLEEAVNILESVA